MKAVFSRLKNVACFIKMSHNSTQSEIWSQWELKKQTELSVWMHHSFWYPDEKSRGADDRKLAFLLISSYTIRLKPYHSKLPLVTFYSFLQSRWSSVFKKSENNALTYFFLNQRNLPCTSQRRLLLWQDWKWSQGCSPWKKPQLPSARAQPRPLCGLCQQAWKTDPWWTE